MYNQNIHLYTFSVLHKFQNGPLRVRKTGISLYFIRVDPYFFLHWQPFFFSAENPLVETRARPVHQGAWPWTRLLHFLFRYFADLRR